MYIVKFRGVGWIEEWRTEDKPLIYSIGESPMVLFKNMRGKEVIVTSPFSVEEK